MPARARTAPAIARRTDLLVAFFGILPAFFWMNDSPYLGLMASFLLPAGIILSGLGEDALLARDPRRD